jgi:arginine deiminase
MSHFLYLAAEIENKNMKGLGITSETSKLKRVIIHRPDEGIERISPKRAEELLFDDIVYLENMQREHDVFTDVLRAFLSEENVWDVTDLLEETISADADSKMELLKSVIEFEELPQKYLSKLAAMSDKELSYLLISGYDAREDHFYFDPLPNLIFTRDMAAIVGDCVIITKAAKEARSRENLLTRMLFSKHPLFKKLNEQGRVIDLNDVNLFPPSRTGEKVSMEGGDMMVINEDCLMIGQSERTSAHAIDLLKKVLFEKDVVKRVVQVAVPSERAFMHIDTLFTFLDEKTVVGYFPIIKEGRESSVRVFDKEGNCKLYSSVMNFLNAEIDPDIKIIPAGGGESPYQEREQWTDGCNLVTLKSGVGFMYGRNVRTMESLDEAGWEIIQAEDLLYQIKIGKVKVEEVEKTIIKLSSGELSRARGGPHCMTCPIWRD